MRVIEGVSHVTIATADVDATAADYARLLGVPAKTSASGARHVFATGNIGVVIRTARPAETSGLYGLAFQLADLAGAREGLARCGLPSSEGDDGVVLDAQATHGIPILLTDRLHDENADRSPIALDHVVISTPDPERAVALYGGRLGLDMRLDRTNPAWKARLMFFRCGELVVEVVHRLSGGSTDGPDTFGGLSWRVSDIGATHERLTLQDFSLSPVRVGRRPGSHVCTVRDRTDSVPTILLGVSPQR